MKKLTLAFLLLATPAYAQLSGPQLATLKTDISANTFVVTSGITDCSGYIGIQVRNIPNNSDGNTCIASVYNLTSSPSFTVWKTNVPINTVGNNFNATELAGLTSLNTQRLQNLAAWLITGVNPSLASVRQFFDDIFSGAGGTNTRAALLILWKRIALRGERLYATGTGSDAVPGLLVYEGSITQTDVSNARNLP